MAVRGLIVHFLLWTSVIYEFNISSTEGTGMYELDRKDFFAGNQKEDIKPACKGSETPNLELRSEDPPRILSVIERIPWKLASALLPRPETRGSIQDISISRFEI